MIIQFEVIPAIKCSKKDVISAIDIYCKSVDTNSKTDTNEIKDYIEYYNNFRYQWNLKKMTPIQYRNHLLSSIA